MLQVVNLTYLLIKGNLSLIDFAIYELYPSDWAPSFVYAYKKKNIITKRTYKKQKVQNFFFYLFLYLNFFGLITDHICSCQFAKWQVRPFYFSIKSKH